MNTATRMQDIWSARYHDAGVVAERAMEIIRRLERECDKAERLAEELLEVAVESCNAADRKRRVAEGCLGILFGCLVDAEEELETANAIGESLAADLVAMENRLDEAVAQGRRWRDQRNERISEMIDATWTLRHERDTALRERDEALKRGDYYAGRADALQNERNAVQRQCKEAESVAVYWKDCNTRTHDAWLVACKDKDEQRERLLQAYDSMCEEFRSQLTASEAEVKRLEARVEYSDAEARELGRKASVLEGAVEQLERERDAAIKKASDLEIECGRLEGKLETERAIYESQLANAVRQNDSVAWGAAREILACLKARPHTDALVSGFRAKYPKLGEKSG